VQALGCWPSRMEIVCVCISGVACLRACPSRVEILQGSAGLGGMASKAEILQGCGGHSPAKRSSCRVVQALGLWPSGMEIMRVCISGTAGLGVWPSRAEIMQGCASLGGGTWPGGNCKCLWIPSLKVSYHGNSAWVGIWGSTALAGQRSRAGGLEIPQSVEQ
jgi:hypothetical protein